jgi:hypothetical protein
MVMAGSFSLTLFDVTFYKINFILLLVDDMLACVRVTEEEQAHT